MNGAIVYEKSNILVFDYIAPTEFTLCSGHTIAASFKSIELGQVLPQTIEILNNNLPYTINNVRVINCITSQTWTFTTSQNWTTNANGILINLLPTNLYSYCGFRAT